MRQRSYWFIDCESDIWYADHPRLSFIPLRELRKFAKALSSHPHAGELRSEHLQVTNEIEQRERQWREARAKRIAASHDIDESLILSLIN